MAELEDMLNQVLSDPEQMNKIAGLAKSLMGGGEPSHPGTQNSPLPIDPKMLGRIQSLMGSSEKSSSSEALLRAMQPYLSEKRRSKMDRALKLARMAKLAGFAMEEFGGEAND